ncbi:protease-like protein [Janthinobacterium sp. HH01]|uniref:PA domain-containing protein n=1 Tax=Janthinobacterium sp. HH01 TaxID=1198452 RepID=UPI0002AE8168|nr:PA domain-containing protein [Janthinobacterium sp. HH01]ELX09074.1 protease-like protein [Janthinobacterium sp. HH01]
MKRFTLNAMAAAAACLFASSTWAAATIVIVNGDPANVGFNDPTVVAPVGGNAGTTLGTQRLNAFQAAANKWGATLTSSSTIRVLSTWEALTCTPTSAVLGSAGATQVFRDFAGAPQAGAWYGKAQTGKLTGSDPDNSTADIRARFNINLGTANCLSGSPFYLGLDGNHGTAVDLVTVLTHEFGHGLGFQTYTNGSTGVQLSGVPSIWDFFLKDATTNKLWKDMTNAERAASSLKSGKLVWTGAIANGAASSLLQQGSPALTLISPASIAGTVQVGTASFGPALNSPGMTGEIMPVVDTAPNLGLACGPLSAANAAAVNGKIALVDRGVCSFTIKAKAVQDAGAIGVIVADNVAGSPPPGLGGADPSVTIPAVRISLEDGNALKVALSKRTRLHSNVFANLGVNLAMRAGADAAGRLLMFAPNPYQSGSSVSHYDTSAFPNLLMEPAINGDLTHEVTPPYDLSFPLLRDIGW